MSYKRKEIVEVFNFLELYIRDKRSHGYILEDLNKIEEKLSEDILLVISTNSKSYIELYDRQYVNKLIVNYIDDWIKYKNDRYDTFRRATTIFAFIAVCVTFFEIGKINSGLSFILQYKYNLSLGIPTITFIIAITTVLITPLFNFCIDITTSIYVVRGLRECISVLKMRSNIV